MDLSRKIFGLFAAFLLYALAACVTGSPLDNYDAIRGTATITEIVKSEYNPDPGVSRFVDVYFSFVPTDVSARERYRYKNWQDTRVRLCVDHRCNLVKSGVEAQGIRPGKSYAAVRYERKGGFGSMPPVFFEVPEFERERAR